MKLYFVTSRKLSDRPLTEVIEEAIAGGVDLVQIREKDMATNELLKLAQKIYPLCQESGVTCIVNSNLEVAQEIGADGIHLGVGSPSISEVRQVMGKEKLIGISIHSVEEAIQAELAGADYLIAGHIYATNSKSGLEPRGLTFLRQVTDVVQIPVYAIGGMTPERVSQVKNAGASGIAVLSGIMVATNPHEVAVEYKKYCQDQFAK